jgi:hypothetical protein
MSDLARVSALTRLLVDMQTKVEFLERQLKDAKAAVGQIEREDLPELMREVGLSSITLEDGSVVEVVNEVECGITEIRRREAHAWLIEHGFGGLIKTEVSVAFGRGERDKAEELSVQINSHFNEHHADMKEVVHPATLKAFVKEQMEAGVNLPQQLFGIFPYSKAKLKRRK